MIAAYQRISRADGDLGKDGKDKSNSIENQKELIQRYISHKESLQNLPVMDFVDAGDDNPPADPCCMAGKVVCGISASLFGMDFLSAGQCATGNGGPFVLDATVARSGSTSNADRWICDFYGPAGGRQRSCTSGTGGSNASAGMVHIRCPPRIACLWNCTKKQRPSG